MMDFACIYKESSVLFQDIIFSVSSALLSIEPLDQRIFAMADNSKGKGKAKSDTSDSNNVLISDILTSLERNSNNPIDKKAVGLLKTIRDLQQQAIERKNWAQLKVVDAESSLSDDFFELHGLRAWKANQERIKNKTDTLEKPNTVQLSEEYVQYLRGHANRITDSVKSLHMQNAQIMADTQALKLSRSESESSLQEVLNREKKCMKKVADLEKQTNILRALCKDEELRALEMEQELVGAERQAKEVELQWRQETKEKECVLALIAEETRKSSIQRACSRIHFSKLRREVETGAQVAEDERRKLEDELSHLRLSSESSARSEINCRICMICMQNEVSVVLLPCTHQVLCFPCHQRKCGAVGAGCPFCHVEIKESILVYGPSP